MYFALGIFVLFVCFIIDQAMDSKLYYMPRLTSFLEGVQWAAFALVVFSLMHFGYFNMI